eukprot:CAMPEP_0182458072 /NCGR_PEP_ID=MMETSP1319-20130603/3502_1 /TAXON_ID=172717 /ORGANISM="Bolidomonas pacifica, Strain RCC208" /LENGTH=199 /DNA_ID=CAMNT_0024656683 /DNA_START=180 /DNA_END=775 /DNA_ORIENTATION=+
MALELGDVKNIFVWLLKLAVAALYYYYSSGKPYVWTALLAAELVEGSLTGVWAWIGHRFVSDHVARSIGWPTGHRFQNEIAWMNAGIAVVMTHGLFIGMLSGPEIRWDAVAAAVLTHGTILLGCAETHFIAIHEDNNWCVSNAGFMLLMVDDIGSVLLKSTLLLASAYGVLDLAQLYATVALLAAASWFTARYFIEVWP